MKSFQFPMIENLVTTHMEPMTKLPFNTEVIAKIDNLNFYGRITGIHTESTDQIIYIVECLNGVFPNENYPYSTVCIQNNHLTVSNGTFLNRIDDQLNQVQTFIFRSEVPDYTTQITAYFGLDHKLNLSQSATNPDCVDFQFYGKNDVLIHEMNDYPIDNICDIFNKFFDLYYAAEVASMHLPNLV